MGQALAIAVVHQSGGSGEQPLRHYLTAVDAPGELGQGLAREGVLRRAPVPVVDLLAQGQDPGH